MRLYGGPYCVDLAPEVGGSVSGLWYSKGDTRIAVLRPSASDSTDPAAMACFPMAPFCNRLREGRLAVGGRSVNIPPNRPGEPHPLHGQAWLAPWTAERRGSDRAVMRCLHEPDHWPWRYEAVQTVSAAHEGVLLRLELRNLDEQPMPAGLGLHPYFPSGPEVRVRTRVGGVLLADADGLPSGAPSPITAAFDLADRAMAAGALDHGYAGWSGRLDIHYPGHIVGLQASSDAGWLQVYAPPGEPWFCAEPMTHASGGLHAPEAQWTELGVRILQPGQTLSLEMRLEVRTN